MDGFFVSWYMPDHMFCYIVILLPLVFWVHISKIQTKFSQNYAFEKLTFALITPQLKNMVWANVNILWIAAIQPKRGLRLLNGYLLFEFELFGQGFGTFTFPTYTETTHTN